jgi:hypothetical protein
MSDERHFDCNYIKDQLRHSRLLAMSVWTDEATASLARSYGAVRLLDKGNLASMLMPTIEECTGEKKDHATRSRQGAPRSSSD